MYFFNPGLSLMSFWRLLTILLKIAVNWDISSSVDGSATLTSKLPTLNFEASSDKAFIGRIRDLERYIPITIAETRLRIVVRERKKTVDFGFPVDSPLLYFQQQSVV